MNRNVATAVLFAFLFAMMLSVRTPETSSVEEGGPRTVSYSQMVEMAQSGQVKTAVLAQGLAYGVNADGGNAVVAVVPEGQAMAEILRQAGVDVRLRPRPVPSPWAGLIGAVLPIFLFFAIYYFIMRKMQGATGMLGRSKAKLVPEVDRGKTTFDNVAGVEEAKVELAEIVEFLRDREKFVQLGAKIPRGVLLVGPPGTGKTLLARAVAGEAGVPFFTTSGSDFVEMFVGLGASRVREMFETARKAAPCILFIDEIDALGRSRGQGFGGGNDEREQTLNAMLVEMDGFSGDSGVIVMGATNRPDVLDRALLRPGRFDRQITVPNPDVKGREEILGVHARKVRLAPGADLKALARGTPGFSGADLANLINEAALLAARRNGKAITTRDLEAAKDRVMMGAERRTLTMSDEERRLTAYHEAGHALVGACMPDSPPVHKATIVPRGRSLGLVMRLPERDETTYSLARLRAEMAVAMAGRMAERIIFGADKVTSGAESDIKQATGLARRMVTAWGFSDRIGPVRLTLGDDEGYLGRPAGGMQDGLSQSTTTVVDDEIRSIVEAGSAKAEEIITTRIEALHAIAQALLARETLDGAEIRALADGKPLPEPVPVQVPSWMGRSSVPDVRRAD